VTTAGDRAVPVLHVRAVRDLTIRDSAPLPAVQVSSLGDARY
jgi:hypothetical protein